ncbi:MAG: type II toxin-antitoxin system HipA family toxin [Clostridiales bacterium]|nr:type II toxin-antitoxin system HipA family toxin [Clostridiales bacterium]
MINTAEVFLWGTRIGIIHQDEDKAYISFEYDNRFLDSKIELSPLKMPLSRRVYSFPELVGNAFHGAPGLVADSLPDKFGNRVIDRWLSEQGRSLSDFNAIDRLCYTGKRGMGALEYYPASGPETEFNEEVDVAKMVKFASDILSEKKDQQIRSFDDPDYSQLIKLGTSAGGARAKALIAWNEEKQMIKSGQIDAGNGFEYWLLKFDGVNKNGDHNLEDDVQYTRIEYAYYLMAKDSGIKMNESRLLEENGRYHFMTKRFDRIQNQKLHMQTLAAIAHIDYNIPGHTSYEEAANITMQLTNSVTDVIELYRRMVFNVIMVNQDDHVKNTAFIMDKKGIWKLAPAYDLTFSYNPDNTWLRAHQMRINSKTESINYNDLIASGKTMGISKVKCDKIIDQVQSIAGKYSDYLHQSGVSDKTIHMLSSILAKNSYQ